MAQKHPNNHSNFVNSPIPEKILPFVDPETIEATLEKFGTGDVYANRPQSLWMD